MARVYVTLTGSPISDIRTSLTKNDILSNDLFYVSQQQLSNVSPDRTYDSGTTIYSNQFKSAKMDYGTLSSMMFERFKEYANFGTMAWESSADYSLIDHKHNYSKVEITSYNSQTDNNGEMLSIASFQIDHNIKKVLWMRKPKEYHLPEPSIGQLKFLALSSIPNVDETKDDFDGWTWPDGRTISNIGGRFSKAAAYFGDSESVDEFALPALTDFIKAANLAETENLQEPVKQHDLLVYHSHQISNIKLTGDKTLECPVQFWRSATAFKGDACHGARDPVEGLYLKNEAVFNASNIEIAGTITEASRNGETYPTHNLLPVMIFIGKPNK